MSIRKHIGTCHTVNRLRHLAFFAPLLSASVSFGAIRAVTPTTQGGDWWKARHAAKLAERTNGTHRVVFIGDSITHFWEGGGKRVWQKYFAGEPYRALDLGFSADRTEHVLWRLTEGGELDGYETPCIVLMIGTNNTGHFPLKDETPIDTIEGIRRILRVIAEKQPKARTILTSIFPRGATATDERRLRNDIVNRALPAFADGRKVVWCDFSDQFLAPDGTLSRDLFPDCLHPNATGYEIWASAVIPLIDKVLATPSDRVIPSVWPTNPQHWEKTQKTLLRPQMGYGSVASWEAGHILEHRNAIADNRSRTFDVVWVGDSITHLWTLPGKNGQDGTAAWAKLSETYNMLNLGAYSDSCEHAYWRLANGELEGYTAKAFALMIGTNNCGGEGAARGIKDLIGLIRARHPESKIILMPIFPRSEKPTDDRRVANEKCNAIIRNYADGQSVIWHDFNARFLTPDGILTRDVMCDLLHPGAKGFEIWAEAMRPVLKDVIGR